MNKLIILCVALILVQGVNGQRFMSKNAYVKFYSYTPLEKIEAVNNTAACVIDVATGNVELSALNTSFQFKKALMQQHFNENYMESSKFPKARFKGKIIDMSKVSFDKPGTYKVDVAGELNMHGVSKPVTVPAVLTVKDNTTIMGEAKFNIKPVDYEVKIPSLVKDNIAKEIEVTCKAELKKV
ncbi:MAG: YceI family protein [Saprospiraceae bacterium]|nr:YceI family protein [Saprospiraceae bacterium]HMW38250.1 YceI family protein [Saprospiraceae bacterium]HMX87445.1 YceI family protein [Saprospiraceae bacterium]HMZ39272.1 YceI family protein [Saprospiraceae bacterium]HNA63433.1 YceI family protein [Saprospiraceae bacterium]